jgi:hypothetical protein
MEILISTPLCCAHEQMFSFSTIILNKLQFIQHFIIENIQLTKY